MKKTEGIRKWVGYFSVIIALWLGGRYLTEAYEVFAGYAFKAYVIFVAGNVGEHFIKKWLGVKNGR